MPLPAAPRTPLRAAASGDPIVDALDELDERNERRHRELSGSLLRIVSGALGGTLVVALVALFLVGESRGIDAADVAKAVGQVLEAQAAELPLDAIDGESLP